MKKLIILSFSICASSLFFSAPMNPVVAGGSYWMQEIKCENGGSVYRCRFDGNQSCDVSGQKHCDEVGSLVMFAA